MLSCNQLVCMFVNHTGCSIPHARKKLIVSDNPGLTPRGFCSVKLVNSVLNLPDGQNTCKILGGIEIRQFFKGNNKIYPQHILRPEKVN